MRGGRHSAEGRQRVHRCRQGEGIRLPQVRATSSQELTCLFAPAKPDRTVDPAPDPDPRKPPRAEKIELTIESLQNYDLIKPIPVIVEPLGDKIFLAEVPEMDLSITGNSVGDTLILLKDHISTVFEGLRVKKNLDTERARQLKALEAYIGRSRRSWF